MADCKKYIDDIKDLERNLHFQQTTPPGRYTDLLWMSTYIKSIHEELRYKKLYVKHYCTQTQ